MNTPNENLFVPEQPTATRVPEVSIQTGRPPVASRGGSSGRSKYAPIFEQVKKLQPDEGWVKFETTPETHDKDLAHIRTALKRQGLFNPDVVKVSSLGGSNKTALCIFIPKGADMSQRDLAKGD